MNATTKAAKLPVSRIPVPVRTSKCTVQCTSNQSKIPLQTKKFQQQTQKTRPPLNKGQLEKKPVQSSTTRKITQERNANTSKCVKKPIVKPSIFPEQTKGRKPLQSHIKSTVLNKKLKKDNCINSAVQANGKENVESVKPNKATSSSSLVNVPKMKKMPKVAPTFVNNKKKLGDKKSTPDYISPQKDFEANEFYRDMILSGKELSPSMMKLQPGLKLSTLIAERPSAYQKMELVSDPVQQALEALKNVHLSSSKNAKISSVIKQSKYPPSPFQVRNSFYTPGVNAKVEALKSLEILKAKRKKNSKKVTFNLDINETIPNANNNKILSSRNLEDKLTNISEENTVHLSPSIEKSSDKQSDNEALENKENEVYKAEKADCIHQDQNNLEKLTVVHEDIHSNDNLCAPKTKSLSYNFSENGNNYVARSTSTLNIEGVGSIYKNTSTETSTSILHKDKNIESVTFLNKHKQFSSDASTLVQNNAIKQTDKKSINAKVHTPRPLSYYSSSNIINSASPEFTVSGVHNSILSDFAPIRTPLVIKSLAKSPDTQLSPVRAKLIFSENPTPNLKVPNTHLPVSCHKVVTTQQKLNNLADQECHFFLKNENFPVICGRYLSNPIAEILSEGDEMHFIPIKT